jgi:hypothetical protein
VILVFFYRRTVLAISIGLLHSYPGIQLLLQLLISLLFTLFVLVEKPYMSTRMVWLELMNEICLFFLLCFCHSFTDATSDMNARQANGWLCIGIITAMILANLGLMVFESICKLIQWIKTKCQNRRAKIQ